MINSELLPYRKTEKLKSNDIRERGYSISSEELEGGIYSIAALIFDNHGNAVAAVNVVAPLTSYNVGCIEKTALPALLETAKQLSPISGHLKA